MDADQNKQRQKELYELITTTHMLCIIILVSALVLSNDYYYPFVNKYFLYNIRLFLLLCLLGSGLILLYNARTNLILKDLKYSTWIDLLYIGFPLIIAIVILFKLGNSLPYAEAIMLLPILIAASIMGKTAGLILSTICSLFLVLYRASSYTETITQSLEEVLIFICVMYVVGWFIGQLTDMEKDHRHYLTQLANTDMLTGLYNHRYFQERLKNFFHKPPPGALLSLLIIDVDYFKHYNDSFGHLAGDDLLKIIGQILMKNVREPGYAARYGGDEFVVAMPGSDCQQAAQIARKIVQTIEETHFPGQEHQPGGKIAVSCGIASYPAHASGARELLRHADMALYRAKSLNKNKVELYFTVFDDLELKENERDLFNSIQTLVSVINAKDRYTYGHSERVTDYSVKLARKIGLPPEEIRLLKYASFLHDIGKIEIDRNILNKKEPLEEQEYALLKQHPKWGSDIVKSVTMLRPTARIILHHHENFDGSGYPYGLSGLGIPLLARIIRITDSYDAMVSHRPYRKNMTPGEAARELHECSGTAFDPELVNAFIQILKDEKEL